MIHKTHKKTLYELWHKKNVGYFRTLGVKCFIHNNIKDHLKAFDEGANEGIFLGYSSTSKALRILNTRNSSYLQVHIHS